MAGKGRRATPSLIQRLLKQPYEFDFFQAVRLLHLWAERHPELACRAQVGDDASPTKEVARFKVLPTLNFPGSPIQKISGSEQGHEVKAHFDSDIMVPAPFEVVCTFFGLFGSMGVLPEHYTRLILDRQMVRDRTMREFFDLFNHRMIALFYRAWEKHRFPIAYERFRTQRKKKRDQPDDLFTRCLFALVGLETKGLRNRRKPKGVEDRGLGDEIFLYFSGHFAHRPRCVISLEELLDEYFGIPVTVEQFVGVWLYLDPGDLTKLPTGSDRGVNVALGQSFVAGTRVWDRRSKFRLRLGPVGYDDFWSLTPLGNNFLTLCELVRAYVGPELDFDLNPILKHQEVPDFVLGGDADSERGPRLGWNTWLHAEPFEEDVREAIFATGR